MKDANFGPLYAACLYPEMSSIARAHGYALAVHGSLARDFDLIAIPWVDRPSTSQQVVNAICYHYALQQAGKPNLKPHGRLAYSLVAMHGDCMIDLQFVLTQQEKDNYNEQQ